MTTEQKNKQKRRKCPKWHFAQANEIAALGFAALSDHILALGYHLCWYKSIFADVL